MININDLYQSIYNSKAKSAWDKGVKNYAIDFVCQLQEDISNGYFNEKDLNNPNIVEKKLLNGAQNWRQFSWGGNALIYDCDIAENLCTPSELKRNNNGLKKPNAKEDWLDVQARALFHAMCLIKIAIKKLKANDNTNNI